MRDRAMQRSGWLQILLQDFIVSMFVIWLPRTQERKARVEFLAKLLGCVLFGLIVLSVFFSSCDTVRGNPQSEANATFQNAAAPLLAKYCLDCHDSQTREADLALDDVGFDLHNPQQFGVWEKVHDKLQAGEMPPADMRQPTDAERKLILETLYPRLHAASAERIAREGRVQYRRLNRVEYENTLRDMLALPHLDVKDLLPADGQAHGFDNVGSALNLSYVQMARYLEAANEAIDAAMALGPDPISTKRRLPALDRGRFAQVVNKGREAVQIGEAAGLLRQPNTAQAPWWWGKFQPSADGDYRLRMKTFGFYWDKGHVLPVDRPHVVTFLARRGQTKRPLGTFDVPGLSDDVPPIEFTTHMEVGELVEIWFHTMSDRVKPDRIPLEEYSSPGVAVEWLEAEGPLTDEWPPTSRRRLFGNLAVEPWSVGTGLREPPAPLVYVGSGKRAKRMRQKKNRALYHVVSDEPTDDARRLLTDFARIAFRRPLSDGELEPYLALVQEKIQQQYCFQESLRVGYQAILCSPDLLFLQESPGRLDDYALASRLSYFLWNSLPDGELLDLAGQGRLNDADTLRAQVERMLGDPKSQRFVENFLGQWLDLRRITDTQPDEQLYPEYDSLLLDSMVEETHRYFSRMLHRNLGVQHLVDSDFLVINSRLAELYEIDDVHGVEMREVVMPADSRRGGFLTQASVLKVTANGTTTSPVTRGAWIVDRILGEPIPPPPANVSAIEPDLRGATTIREQLAAHRENASCAVCHRRMDPPGFALENFDVIGGWRDRYRVLENGDEVERNTPRGRPVQYKLGPVIDSSGEAPSGESFTDINSFRTILLDNEKQLARNLAQRLLVFATGAGIEFADRATVERILQQSQNEKFGLRTLIHNVVQSETFRSK